MRREPGREARYVMQVVMARRSVVWLGGEKCSIYMAACHMAARRERARIRGVGARVRVGGAAAGKALRRSSALSLRLLANQDQPVGR